MSTEDVKAEPDLESIPGILIGLGNVCLSGGADGADSQWGMMAGRNGHTVIHFSFDEHRSSVPNSEQVVLTQEMLEMADTYVSRANLILKRRWPSSSVHTNNLLRRNWYQIAWTSAVYAVGKMTNGNVDGGTAWAVAMYQQRFLNNETPWEECRLYFYEQATKVWWQWDQNGWTMRINAPPAPSGIWTGIGTRELSIDGKWEIRQLMGGYPVTPQVAASLIPITANPEIGSKVYLPAGGNTIGFMTFTWTGGWATVTSVRKGSDDTWINIQELNSMEFSWNKLVNEQVKLQNEFGINRSYMKF